MTTGGSGRALASSGARFAIAPLARSVGVLAMLPLMTRVLSAGALGVVATAQVVSNLLLAFAALGLHSAANREFFGNDSKDGDPVLARSLALTAVIATLAFTAFAHLTGQGWVRVFGSQSYDLPLQLAVLTVIPMSLLVVSQNLLKGEDRPLPFGFATLAATLGGQTLGLILATTGDGTAAEYLTGVFVGYALGGVLAAVASRLRGRLITRQELVGGLRLGLPTIPHSLGIFLLQVGDRIVIDRELGIEAVGRYQVAYLLGSGGIMLILACSAAWAPMIFRVKSDRERWELLASTTSVVHWFAGLACASIVLTAPVLLRIAAPTAYRAEDLVPVVLIIAPSAVVYVSFQAASFVLFQQRHTRALGVISMCSALLNLAGNVFLVDHLGLRGAAIATLAGYAVWAFAVRRAAARHATLRWDDKALVGALVLVGISIIASLLLGDSQSALITAFRIGLAVMLSAVGMVAVLRNKNSSR